MDDLTTILQESGEEADKTAEILAGIDWDTATPESLTE
jgi:hypothetical protein